MEGVSSADVNNTDDMQQSLHRIADTIENTMSTLPALISESITKAMQTVGNITKKIPKRKT